jgi:hypothetical protein
MKAIYTISTACAGVSLLGLVGLSAMSVAPSGAAWHTGMMLAVAVFLVGWGALAFWARRQLRLSRGTAFPPTAKTALITGGVIYMLLVLLCSIA